MSQPRRRRRRGRRRPNRSGDQTKREAVEQSRTESDGKPPAPPRAGNRSRRSGRGRRGRTRNREARGGSSPKSSEDLVRGDPKRPPAQLTADHDGTTLEQVIGDLQSEHGVPQHPQEYRITLKVADERGDKSTVVEEKIDATEDTEIPPGGPDAKPKREKAPAAPRIGSSAAEAEGPSGQPRGKKKRSRRRRRRPKGKPGGSPTGGGTSGA